MTHQAAMIGVAYWLSYTALERTADVRSEETLPFADQFATLISTKSDQTIIGEKSYVKLTILCYYHLSAYAVAQETTHIAVTPPSFDL